MSENKTFQIDLNAAEMLPSLGRAILTGLPTNKNFQTETHNITRTFCQVFQSKMQPLLECSHLNSETGFSVHLA